jgi:hypothetical protein
MQNFSKKFKNVLHITFSSVYGVADFSLMPARIRALQRHICRSIVPQERDQSWQNMAEFWRGNEA